MPVERLTQELAEQAAPGDLYWDDKIRGLLLLAGKKTKTWYAQREVKDGETGIRKTARVKLGRFPDLSVQEARQQAKEELRKMEAGRNPHDERKADLTVQAAIEEYVRAGVDLRPKTLYTYRYHLDHYLNGLAAVPLSQLGSKPAIVRHLHQELTTKHGKGTANSVLRTISAAYNGALALGLDLPQNPVTRPGVIRWHRLKPRDRRIPEDGFTAWAQAVMTIQNPIRRALQCFLLLTGQRDEATRLMRWEHIDFKRGLVHYPSPKGGEAKAFDLPMSEPVRQVLKFVRVFSEQGWAYAGSPWTWPTTQRRGGIGPTRESKEQRRAELINAHSLRRTFVSVGYECAPSKFVSYIANHACKDSITDDYFNPGFESIKQALTTIDAAILQKIGIPLDELLGNQMVTSSRFGQGPSNLISIASKSA